MENYICGFENFEIGTLGYNHSHSKDFFIEYPDGIGCYLFLLIKTPANYKINGHHYDIKPNTFLIISPKTQLIYRAKNQPYTDDWCYFTISEKDRKFLDELGIPLDEPIQLENSEELSNIIHFITFEHFSAELYHKELEKQYINILFYKLSRIIKTNIYHSSDLFASKNDKLIFLRSKIFSEPNFFENVDAMADFMSISRSGFQHLYKNTFGINVMTDVISGRVEFSKNLLASTSLTIAEVAAKTGYKSEFAYMRQFKEKTGLTPTEYRKADNWTQNHH